MVWHIEATCGIMDHHSMADKCAGGMQTMGWKVGAADGKMYLDLHLQVWWHKLVSMLVSLLIALLLLQVGLTVTLIWWNSGRLLGGRAFPEGDWMVMHCNGSVIHEEALYIQPGLIAGCLRRQAIQLVFPVWREVC